MQVSKFTTGGFVIHKATIPNRSGHYSAWYDIVGKLIDASRFDKTGREYNVHHQSPAWNELQSIGNVHKP